MQKYMGNSAAAGDTEQHKLDVFHGSQHSGCELVKSLSSNRSPQIKIGPAEKTIEDISQLVIGIIEQENISHDTKSVLRGAKKNLKNMNKINLYDAVEENVINYFKQYRTYLLNLPIYEQELVIELGISASELVELKNEMPSIKERVDYLITLRFIKNYTWTYENTE